jgi:hypothetical protein
LSVLCTQSTRTYRATFRLDSKRVTVKFGPVSYRRDDNPNGAARIRDGLASTLGKDNQFMEVDDLLAGQRFDEELAKGAL